MRLSYSKVETFLKCPRQYYYRYVLGIRDESSPWSEFGTICHETLEEYCKNKWNDRSLMLYYFRKRLDASDKIPYNLKNKFVGDGFKIFFQFPTHQIIHEQTFGIETKIELDLGEGFTLVSYIDRLALAKDTLQIIDYKSSNQPDPEKYMRQLQIYDMGVALQYPEFKKRTTHLHWLKHNKIDTFTFNADNAEKTRAWLVSVGKQMQAMEKNKDINTWEKVKNDGCTWCVPFNKECWG